MHLAIIASLLLALPSLVFAGEVGRVTYAEGRVDVLSSGAEKAVFAKEGTFINIGDSIRVKSNSKAEITFLDKTTLKVAENSKVNVVDYQFGPDNSRKTATIKLERGKVRTTIAKMEDSAEFKIDTPNASGSVKGSDVYTYFQGGNSGMIVTEGILTVFNPSLPDSVLKVPAGSAVMIPLKEAPKGPREYMEIEKKLHEQDTSVPDNISSRKNASIIKGRIVKFTGDTKIITKDAIAAHGAVIDEVISEGDKIITGPDGIVEVSFDNGNAVYLKPNTNITILRLVFDAKSGEYENMFQSDGGKIKARIEKLEGKSKFEIKTPTAVCGARGTIMYLNIAPGGVTEAFYEGGNGYTTNLISGQTMEVGSGSGATSDTSGGVTETASDSGSLGGDSGSGMDEGWDPSGGTSDHTSTESTTDNYMYSSDTSAAGVSGSSDTSDVADMALQAGEGTTGDNGLDNGEVDIPITVADPAITTEEESMAHGGDATITIVSPTIADCTGSFLGASTGTWTTSMAGTYTGGTPGVSENIGYYLVGMSLDNGAPPKSNGVWILNTNNAWANNVINGTGNGMRFGLSTSGLVEIDKIDDVADRGLINGSYDNGTWSSGGAGNWSQISSGTMVSVMTALIGNTDPYTTSIPLAITETALFSLPSPSNNISSFAIDMTCYTIPTRTDYGVWLGNINGTFTSSGPTLNVGMALTDAGSSGTLTFTAWAGSLWVADISGTTGESRTFEGVAKGTTTSTTFSGAAVGTWEDAAS